ncbi:MAG TPA: hypothetical protein ENK02_07840 [Planctomycetes bacterium]|nr:hypothetical protein [Planctomycetota bacterium]
MMKGEGLLPKGVRDPWKGPSKSIKNVNSWGEASWKKTRTSSKVAGRGKKEVKQNLLGNGRHGID